MNQEQQRMHKDVDPRTFNVADQQLAACKNKVEVKALLRERHAAWKKKHGAFVVCPAVQLSLWDHSEASTDVAERNHRQIYYLIMV
jgi:hypothetical protein